MLGAVLALSSCGWLLEAQVAPASARGVGLITVGVIGASLVVVGVLRALRAPIDPGVQALRAIAGAVERYIGRLDQTDGFSSAHFVPLSVTGNRRQKRLTPSALWRQAQSTVIIGHSGAGKTVSLRRTALEACKDVQRRRHPKRIALYIDLAAFPDSGESISVDQMYSYIQQTVTSGDVSLAANLARYLRGPSDDREWLILFDSFGPFDDLTKPWEPTATDKARRYLDAIQELLSTAGPHVRAVIATRQWESLEYFSGSALTISPLSTRQIRRISKQAGLDSADRRRLVSRVACDPALDPIARSPLLFGLLCDHLRNAATEIIPDTAFDVISAALDTRIHKLLQDDSLEDVTQAAERIAHILVERRDSDRLRGDDPPILSQEGISEADPHLGSAINSLERAGIVRSVKRSVLTFAHSCFLDHFLSSWLLRTWERCDTRTVITDLRWREAAITALSRGSSELRHMLVTTASEVLAEETAKASGVISDVTAIVMLNNGEPLPTPTVFFLWPRMVFHVLQILTNGLGDRSEEYTSDIRTNTDRFVVSAFVAGMLLDQKRAIEVLNAATPDVALWAIERSTASSSALLHNAAVRQLVSAPHLYAQLRRAASIRSIVKAAQDATVVNWAVWHPQRLAPTSSTLTGRLRDLIRAGQLTAFLLLIFSLDRLINQIAHINEWPKYGIPPNPFFWAGLIILSTLAISTWYPRRRGPETLGNAVSVIFSYVVGIAAIGGVIGLITAAVLLVTLRIPGAIIALFVAYITTWPAAMAALIAINAPPVSWEWWLPQLPLIRTGVGVSPRYYVQVLLGQSTKVDTSMTPESTTGAMVLQWLQEASTQRDTEQVLRRLSSAPPATNAPMVSVLEDLARALEHVARLVPTATISHIPPGIWEVGPTYAEPGFTEWLRRFDQRYPGRLCWLAANHREEIAAALERAESYDLP
jgi:hypothetical protein